jgi:hypothetical protein
MDVHLVFLAALTLRTLSFAADGPERPQLERAWWRFRTIINVIWCSGKAAAHAAITGRAGWICTVYFGADLRGRATDGWVDARVLIFSTARYSYWVRKSHFGSLGSLIILGDSFFGKRSWDGSPNSGWQCIAIW